MGTLTLSAVGSKSEAKTIKHRVHKSLSPVKFASPPPCALCGFCLRFVCEPYTGPWNGPHADPQNDAPLQGA